MNSRNLKSFSWSKITSYISESIPSNQFFFFNICGSCIMLNSEINPTRCNNCVYSSQWLYSTCFGWQFHTSSGVHMLHMASGRQVYCKLTKSVITIIFDTTANMQSQVFIILILYIIHGVNLQYTCLPEAIYSICTPDELSPKTCRGKPLRRINAIVASCWIYFTTVILWSERLPEDGSPVPKHVGD